MVKTKIKLSALTWFLILIVQASLVYAYTGSFAFTPPLPGGPISNDITNFNVDFTAYETEIIEANLDFIKEVHIILNENLNNIALKIAENPSSGQTSDGSFSFNLPQKAQDALVEATIYFWGGDVPSITIEHVHNGEVTEILTAERAEPEQQDSDGRILWKVKTYSFSDFYIGGKRTIKKEIPTVHILLLLFSTVSACILLRSNGN